MLVLESVLPVGPFQVETQVLSLLTAAPMTAVSLTDFCLSFCGATK